MNRRKIPIFKNKFCYVTLRYLHLKLHWSLGVCIYLVMAHQVNTYQNFNLTKFDIHNEETYFALKWCWGSTRCKPITKMCQSPITVPTSNCWKGTSCKAQKMQNTTQHRQNDKWLLLLKCVTKSVDFQEAFEEDSEGSLRTLIGRLFHV